jgi:hypothetical protein
MVVICNSCHTLHWLDESLSNSSKRNPRFGMCCYQGKVMPSYLYHPPSELYNLLTLQTPIQTAFHKDIYHYNNLLAFTSVRRDVDDRYNNG